MELRDSFFLKKDLAGLSTPSYRYFYRRSVPNYHALCQIFQKNFPDDLLDPDTQALLYHPGSPESQKPVWQERIRTSICCLLGSPELPMRPPYQTYFCSSAIMQTITQSFKKPQASALSRTNRGSLKHLRSLSRKLALQERIRTSICPLFKRPELPMRPPYRACFLFVFREQASCRITIPFIHSVKLGLSNGRGPTRTNYPLKERSRHI